MTAQVQKTVTFYGDELIAIQETESNSIFVPLNRLCDNLGIARNRQVQRIRDHPVLSRGYQALPVETSGGTQETQCLRLDLIPLWLAGINANRVAAPVQAKLIQYQAEAATVLWAAFRPDILPAAELAQEPGKSGAVLAYEIATAIQHLARQQMEIEQRLGGRIEQMARWARDFSHLVDQRLTTLELQVSPQTAITEQQAAEIALAVKHVGHALASQGTKSGYSQVYGEMYRRYGIASYKNLPQAKYPEVLAWLRQWHTDITGATTDAAS